MSFNKDAFVFFMLTIAFNEVSSWTVDLPEVRRFLFEKYDDHKTDDQEYVDDDKKIYSNIEGNSLHHKEPHQEYDDKNYADNYGYVSYMEKKVGGAVQRGGTYLEGLRRSVERYAQFLEGCDNRNRSSLRNMTSWQPPSDSLPRMSNNESIPSNVSMFNPPSFNFSEPNSPSFNFSEPSNISRASYNASNTTISCEEVNERSEHVRRLAQLAIWSTMRLQDLAYASKYQKIDEYEENELVLKLAWFLDRLAYLTGYEPDPSSHLPTTTRRPTTTTPVPLTLVPAPEPIKTAMMNCIKENSSTPATERCRYPLPLPDLIRQMFNITNMTDGSIPTDASPAETVNVIPVRNNDGIPRESLELLVTSDDNPFRNYPPFRRSKRHIDDKTASLYNTVEKQFNQLAIVKYFKDQFKSSKSMDKSNKILNYESLIKILNKIPSSEHFKKLRLKQFISSIEYSSSRKFDNQSIKKRIDFNNKPIKSIYRRSIDNAMTKLMNYYYKYKVWEGSNPLRTDQRELIKRNNYDAENDSESSKRIQKRSLLNHQDGHIDVLAPLRNLRNFIKHKQRIHYNTFVLQKPKIIAHLESIRHQINLNKAGKVDLTKTHVHKRSLYYDKMYLPREPANPMGDISFYVKNKEGRNYNPSLAQAAQVRLGLEQVFQNGNIEVVRRYGSNYNPADPAPFYTGVLRTMADS